MEGTTGKLSLQFLKDVNIMKTVKKKERIVALYSNYLFQFNNTNKIFHEKIFLKYYFKGFPYK